MGSRFVYSVSNADLLSVLPYNAVWVIVVIPQAGRAITKCE